MTSHLVENIGSTARDYCMLERNILSHLKLALLLSILSSSLLLHARLVPDSHDDQKSSSIPLASIEFVAAMACIVAGVWEYYSGYQDLRNSRAFLVGVKCVLKSYYLCKVSHYFLTADPIWLWWVWWLESSSEPASSSWYKILESHPTERTCVKQPMFLPSLLYSYL